MLIHRDENGLVVHAMESHADGVLYRATLTDLMAPGEKHKGKRSSAYLWFQRGLPSEAGVNGLTNEALLAIIEHRLMVLNRAPYSCHENLQAINAVRQAQGALKRRTMRRQDRQVEGTSAPEIRMQIVESYPLPRIEASDLGVLR